MAKQTSQLKKVTQIGDTTSPATSAKQDEQTAILTDIETNTNGISTEAKQDDIISELQSLTGFEIPAFDTIEATYPTDTTEVYTYKSSGDTVATITVTYTDDTKEVLSSVAKT